MNEKNKKKLEAKRFRTVWKFSPVTRIIKSKKKYNRKKTKGEVVNYGKV